MNGSRHGFRSFFVARFFSSRRFAVSLIRRNALMTDQRIMRWTWIAIPPWFESFRKLFCDPAAPMRGRINGGWTPFNSASWKEPEFCSDKE